MNFILNFFKENTTVTIIIAVLLFIYTVLTFVWLRLKLANDKHEDKRPW